MLADEVDYVVGVDTHRDQHVLAVVAAPTSAVVAQRSFAANARGYVQALRFAEEYAGGRRVWAVEGAGHYGAGLARCLSGRGETVLEAGRAPRGERRLRGKDDGLDAIRAARACRERGNGARRCVSWRLPAEARSTSAARRSCSCVA
jgi:transposase